MLLNLSVDMLSGAVPVIGDIWDFLPRQHPQPGTPPPSRTAAGEVRSTPRDALIVAGAMGAFVIALAAPLLFLVLVLRELLQ